MHARYGSSAAEHFAPLRSGVWWWVITHHQPFNFQPDLDRAEKEHGMRIRLLRPKSTWHRQVRAWHSMYHSELLR